MNSFENIRVMKWKLIRCAAIPVLIAMFLGACSDEELETFEKKKPLNLIEEKKKKLNWIGHWLNEHDREVIVRDVAKEFAIKNPNIDLKLKFPQNIRGYRSKRDIAKLYVEMIRTRNFDWDVIWLDDQIYQYVADDLKDLYWGKKHLVDFGKIPGFKETQKDFIFENPKWAAQTGDIIVGPMLEGYYHAIFYNKVVADKLGIKVKEMGMTFDDLLSYVKAVFDYNEKNGTNIAAFYESTDWTCQEILFQRLLRSEIGVIEKSMEHKGSKEKNDAVKKTFEALEKLGKYKPLIKNYQGNIWFQTRHFPLNDKVLFYVNGIWMYNHWMSADETKANKMIPAELPVFREVNFYQGGYIPTWAVWKDAPHKEEGIKLMKFWSRPHVAEKWTRYTNAPTGLKGEATKGTESTHPFAVWQRKITTKYDGNIYYLSNTAYIFGEKKGNALLLDDLKKEILELLDGKITAQESYDRFMAKVK
jgi:ABC-type glycerol-3-phosphate transport system substrate-binding protein